jgi:hypothetical protein
VIKNLLELKLIIVAFTLNKLLLIVNLIMVSFLVVTQKLLDLKLVSNPLDAHPKTTGSKLDLQEKL